VLGSPVLVREDLCHNKAAWVQIYTDGGVKALANTVMREEIEQRLAAKNCLYVNDMEWSAHVMENILLSTDQTLLKSTLYGNLALDRIRDRGLTATPVG
jgi:hypothetical protein